MARQAKFVAAGVYQPKPRQAYGPRRRGRCDLVECEYDVLTASAAARYVYDGHAYGHHLSAIIAGPDAAQVVALPMPRGGVRWVIVCPVCKERATRLYGRWHPHYRAVRHACRACYGLRYQSQYAGRRLEAHPDYLQVAIKRIAERPGYLAVAQRRMRHLLAAQVLLTARTQRHIERREIAFLLTEAQLVARFTVRQARRWQWLVPSVIERGDPATMRELLTHVDTPTWAVALLTERLAQAEAGETSRDTARTLRKQVKQAAKTDEMTQFVAIVEQARIDDLRTRYAALGQTRRAKEAA